MAAAVWKEPFARAFRKTKTFNQGKMDIAPSVSQKIPMFIYHSPVDLGL